MAITKSGLLALVIVGAAQVNAKVKLQPPAEYPEINTLTPQGCFSALPSEANRVQQSSFMTTGQCWENCKKDHNSVAILSGNNCYCAETYPAKSSLVDDSQCNSPCPGYPREACGGTDPVVYSVYNTGNVLTPGYDEDQDNDDDSKSTASTVSTAPESITTTHVVKTTSVSTNALDTTTDTTTAKETETKDASTPTTSQIAPVVNENPAATTPSASTSTVPENASSRHSNPIGNVIRMMMQLL
ncbi:hypothetical protein FLONG3_835 [Fusarium longipes]|uniref:WSC domain-containing protein n=1 Tax=Fusarium longipes TaxID=694270 RepID=A0A395T9A5_9HYPO|nr:hypothetical protein FLONG3_835 [Fusarium longipes]